MQFLDSGWSPSFYIDAQTPFVAVLLHVISTVPIYHKDQSARGVTTGERSTPMTSALGIRHQSGRGGASEKVREIKNLVAAGNVLPTRPHMICYV